MPVSHVRAISPGPSRVSLELEHEAPTPFRPAAFMKTRIDCYLSRPMISKTTIGAGKRNDQEKINETTIRKAAFDRQIIIYAIGIADQAIVKHQMKNLFSAIHIQLI